MKIYKLIIIVIVSIIVGFITYSHSRFNSKVNFVSYNPEQQLWLHRVNSLERLNYAKEKNFTGIEVDIFYDQSKDIFKVTHDWTDKEDVLNLHTMLLNISPTINIWLDIKNLTKANATKVAQKINTLLKDIKLQNTVIAESRQWQALKILNEHQINTSFWINFNKKSRIYKLRLYLLKYIIAYTDFSTYSMNYTNYDEDMRAVLNAFPIMLFTFKDSTEAQPYLDFENVKVALVDY